jgi:hypothetical protein
MVGEMVWKHLKLTYVLDTGMMDMYILIFILHYNNFLRQGLPM